MGGQCSGPPFVAKWLAYMPGSHFLSNFSSISPVVPATSQVFRERVFMVAMKQRCGRPHILEAGLDSSISIFYAFETLTGP